MRGLLKFLIVSIALLGTGYAQAQVTTIPVTGNLTQILGTPSPYAGVSLQLQNCPAPITIPGTGIVVQQNMQVSADASGVVNTAVWPTDVIDCNGTTGNSQYAVQYIVNGTPIADPVCYAPTSSLNVWNLQTLQPVTCGQSPPAPGDVTYNNVVVTGCLSIKGSSCSSTPPWLSQIGGILSGTVQSGTTSPSYVVPNKGFATVNAACDGTTDDTATINASIAAAPAGFGLKFPAGTCKISNELTVTAKTNLALIGQRTKIVQSSANKATFRISGSTGVDISGFDLVGFGADYVNSPSGITGADLIRTDTSSSINIHANMLENYGEAGVMFNTTSHIGIVNNDFIGPGSAIVPVGGNGNFGVATYNSGAGYSDITITNNRMRNTGMGIYLSNDWAQVNIATNNISTVGQHCVYVYTSQTSVIGNVCVATSAASYGCVIFRLNPGATADSVGDVVEDNQCVGQVAFTVEGGVHKFVGPKIEGNSFTNTYEPIQITNDQSSVYDAVGVSIKNNTFINTLTGSAIQAQGDGDISENTMDGSTWSCIYTFGETWNIHDNTMSHCGSSGTGGPTNQSGIYSAGSLARVYHNTIGAGTGMVNSIYGNVGGTVEQWDNTFPSANPVLLNGSIGNHNAGPWYMYNFGNGEEANFENIGLFSLGNVFYLQTSRGGTGVARDFAINMVDVGNVLYGHAATGFVDLGVAADGVNLNGAVNALNSFKVGGGAPITNSNALPQVGTPAAGHAACIKTGGPPVTIGYCTTQPDASGVCTCN